MLPVGTAVPLFDASSDDPKPRISSISWAVTDWRSYLVGSWTDVRSRLQIAVFRVIVPSPAVPPALAALNPKARASGERTKMRSLLLTGSFVWLGRDASAVLSLPLVLWL